MISGICLAIASMSLYFDSSKSAILGNMYNDLNLESIKFFSSLMFIFLKERHLEQTDLSVHKKSAQQIESQFLLWQLLSSILDSPN